MSISIITPRLQLAPLTPSDAPFMRQIVNTEGWIRFIGDRKVHSDEDARAYVSRLLGTEHLLYRVVRLRETGQAIGVVSFMKRNYLDHFDLGFAFLPEYQQQGYAYEAAAAVLDFAHQTHEIILATTLPDNTASIGLLTKLGFSPEGEIMPDNERLCVFRSVRNTL